MSEDSPVSIAKCIELALVINDGRVAQSYSEMLDVQRIEGFDPHGQAFGHRHLLRDAALSSYGGSSPQVHSVAELALCLVNHFISTTI